MKSHTNTVNLPHKIKEKWSSFLIKYVLNQNVMCTIGNQLSWLHQRKLNFTLSLKGQIESCHIDSLSWSRQKYNSTCSMTSWKWNHGVLCLAWSSIGTGRNIFISLLFLHHTGGSRNKSHSWHVTLYKLVIFKNPSIHLEKPEIYDSIIF